MLGHALGMRLIHGTKTKNDKLDSEKIARLLHSGHFPLADVYPRATRATRDLLRRRLYFVRRRADLHTHLQIVEAQYNLEPLRARLDRVSNRSGYPERFPTGSARLSIAADCRMLDALEQLIRELERALVRTAKVDDLDSFCRLRTVLDATPPFPGIDREHRSP